MRLRVLVPLLLFGVLAITAILIPVGTSIAQSRTQELQLQRAAAMQHIVQRAYSAFDTGDPSELEHYLERFVDTYGEAVMVVDASGNAAVSAGDIALDDEVAAVVAGALRGVPQWRLPTITPWSAGYAVVAEPVTLDGRTPEGAVVLRVDQESAQRDVAGSWATILAVGAALLLAVLLASVAWTRWVLRPVSALDAAANALAENRGFALDEAAGPPELRRLSRSFARMARSVELALDQQHGLVADASHQLRNPLAAIRLRIDALGGRPPDDPEIDEILAIERDLDRLEHTVTRMLTLANAEHRATAASSGHGAAAREASPRDIDEALLHVSAASLIDPHRAPLAAAGVAIVADERVHPVRFRLADLEEIVELLVDNAAKYAAGTTLTVEFEARNAGGSRDARTALVFSDSGAGLATTELPLVGTRFWRAPAHLRQPGTGLGYAIVVQLARANDAEMVVDHSPAGGLRTTIIASAS